jgi:serine/threonine-protein kinase
LQQTLSAFLYSGVTTVLDVGNPTVWAATQRDRIERGELFGPRFFTTGMRFSQAPSGWDGAVRAETVGEPDPAELSTKILSPDPDVLSKSLDVYVDNDIEIIKLYSGVSTLVNNNPVWAPDGERIAFRSDRDGGNANLYVQAISGTGEAERVTNSAHLQDAGSWSPDGRLVAFDELSLDTGVDLWTVDLVEDRTTTPYLQTEFNEQAPSFSPDGRWIAYQSDATGRDEIYIGPFPASTHRWQVSTEGGVETRWSSDGRELFYRNGRKLMAVDVQTGTEPILGKPNALFETSERIGNAFDVSPDAQRFVMIDESADPLPLYLNLVLNWDEELKRLVP